MRAKAILFTLVLCFAATSVVLAKTSPHMGTWKLNEAKSKIAPGTGKNDTVVYEAAGNDVKITVDGTDANGQPTHNEWTGKFDGKFYALTGDPTADKRSYKVANSRTLLLTNQKDGKVTITGRIVVSPNGKTRTVTTKGTDPQGKRFTSIAVYDKG